MFLKTELNATGEYLNLCSINPKIIAHDLICIAASVDLLFTCDTPKDIYSPGSVIRKASRWHKKIGLVTESSAHFLSGSFNFSGLGKETAPRL